MEQRSLERGNMRDILDPPSNSPDIDHRTTGAFTEESQELPAAPAANSNALPGGTAQAQVPPGALPVSDTAHSPAADHGTQKSQPVTESSDPKHSQELWDKAYDMLERDEGKLVEAYM